MENPWAVTYAAAPPSVRPWLLSLEWDALRAAAREVELMPLRELDWILELPLWWQGGRPFRLRPRDVLRAPGRFPAQHARALESDLAHPVDVAHHLGRWVTVDGVHRLLKATALGHTAVAMREVPVVAVRSLAA
jgi:hypothetical protein